MNRFNLVRTEMFESFTPTIKRTDAIAETINTAGDTIKSPKPRKLTGEIKTKKDRLKNNE